MNAFKTLLSFACAVVVLSTNYLNCVEKSSAAPVVKLSGDGFLEFSTSGPSGFVLQGNASHLGKYTCYGEIEFPLGAWEGALAGEGVAVLVAANGDKIVGIINWQVDSSGNTTISFKWRDFVEFNDGTIEFSTGRFVKSRPAGAVSRLKTISDGTSNIIAILIG